MMIKKLAGAAVLLFALSIPVIAQQPPQAPKAPAGPQGMRPRMVNVEMALRMKEQLKLTDAQASQLEALRKEIVAERQARAHDMIDVQSRLAAGIIKREDVRKQFEDKRDAMRQSHEQLQDRVAKVLTDEQRQTLQFAERRLIMQRARMRGAGRGGFGPGGFGPGGFGPGRQQGFGGRPGFGARHPFGRGFRPMQPMPPRGPGFDEQP